MLLKGCRHYSLKAPAKYNKIPNVIITSDSCLRSPPNEKADTSVRLKLESKPKDQRIVSLGAVSSSRELKKVPPALTVTTIG